MMAPSLLPIPDMAKEAFRLVRSLPDGAGHDWDYLVSFHDGIFQFSVYAKDAMVFDSWEEFVAAAQAVLQYSGPCDVLYERIYTVSWRPVCHA